MMPLPQQADILNMRKLRPHNSGAFLRAVNRSGAALFCAAAILACLVAGASCTPNRDVGVLPQTWAEGPSAPIESSRKPPDETAVFRRDDPTIRLSGAVNEIIAFEFVLSAAEGQAVGLELSAGDLAGPIVIRADAVRLYRHWPVVIERFPNWFLRSRGLNEPREFPDVLVPVTAPHGGQPFNVPPGGKLPIWIEIAIPEFAEPGVYHGGIDVRDSAGRTNRTPIELTVRDIYLSPDDAIPIPARVRLGPLLASHTSLDPSNIRLALTDPEARRVLLRAFEMLHEHGLSPYTDDVRPLLSQDMDGKAVLDWSQYDDFCGPLIDGSAYADRRPAYAWPLPVDLLQPEPVYYGGMQSAAYAAVLKDCLGAACEHFAEHGWLGRAFVQTEPLVCRDPRPTDADTIRQFTTIMRLVDGTLPFVSTLIPQPMAPFGWSEHRYEDLSGEVGIWAPPGRYSHPSTAQRLRTLGKRFWLVPDRPPFSGTIAVEALPVQARSLPWQAFMQQQDAILLPAVTNWPPEILDEPITDRRQTSDAWLLYPGKLFGLDEPVPSVRLKQLQLGMQDYQYLRLLERNGRGETARLLGGSLIKASGTDAYGDNYQDALFGRLAEVAESWELARHLLEEEVAFTVSPEPDKVMDPAVNRATWAKFLGATRTLRLWSESARLTFDERSKEGGMLAAFEVAVRSELRTPLVGQLSFSNLSPGFRSVSDIVRVGPIEEMGLVRKQIVAGVPGLPQCDLDGHLLFEILLDAGTTGRVTATGTLSVVRAVPAAGPIVVDGDLSDWLPSEGNTVGDFRLINGRGDGVKPGERASSQTVCFVCQHDGHLCIGLHAATPRDLAETEERPHRFSNVLAYEDLMPIGADLVEILIDPTNTGTQSGDLYYIVLQSTGDPVFQRGVPTQPPIGPCEPWPGPLPSYCVATTEYGWSAEVSIPIDGFGPQAAKNLIWGFNVARLEPQRGEYSNWACAPRYCYDPRTLGNLVWSTDPPADSGPPAP